MAERKRTLPEALDAAQNGTEFGLAIMDMFAALDRARFKEEEAEDGDGDR